MINTELKLFIRETLGCGCPENVFEEVEIEQIQHQVLPVEFFRIVIGDTLLIYLVVTHYEQLGSDHVLQIASEGQTDRDERRYNRFRLVLPLVTGDVTTPDLEQDFDRKFKNDKKTHIHFVSSNTINSLLKK